MPVVINEFEVVAEPAPAPAQAQASNEATPQPALDVEQALLEMKLRELRVRDLG